VAAATLDTEAAELIVVVAWLFPLLTQIMMTSVIDVVDCTIMLAPSLLLLLLLALFEIELELLLELSFELWDDISCTPVSRSTAPRAIKSACSVPANANGAAHSAVIAENLMVVY